MHLNRLNLIVIQFQPVEIVQQITENLLNIGETWKGEATKLWNSFTAVIDSAALALQALWAIVSKAKVAMH
jgi:3-hydroxyisobutyrate dehydrogenase-like beta-hydroxyacid dehydrogenase